MTRWLRDDELQLWRTCMHVALTVQGCIADDFKIHGITVADYSVLVPLSESPTGKCSVGQIARKGAWDAPGLARHIRRMEERGLVQRTASHEGTSGTAIELTPRAQELMSSAAPQHVERVRSILFDALDEDDLESLRNIINRLAENLPERLLGYASEPLSAGSLRSSLILSAPESEKAALDAEAKSQEEKLAEALSDDAPERPGAGSEKESADESEPSPELKSASTESDSSSASVNVSQTGGVKLSSISDLGSSPAALNGSAEISASGKDDSPTSADPARTAQQSDNATDQDDSAGADADAGDRALADDVQESLASTNDDTAKSIVSPASDTDATTRARQLPNVNEDSPNDTNSLLTQSDEPATSDSVPADNNEVSTGVSADTSTKPNSASTAENKDAAAGVTNQSSTQSLYGLSARMVDNLDRLDRFGMGEPITYPTAPLPKIEGITDTHSNIVRARANSVSQADDNSEAQSSDSSSPAADELADSSQAHDAPAANVEEVTSPAQTEGAFEAEYAAAYENNTNPPREGHDKYQHYSYGPSPLPSLTNDDEVVDSVSDTDSAAPPDQDHQPATPAGRRLGALTIDDTVCEQSADDQALGSPAGATSGENAVETEDADSNDQAPASATNKSEAGESSQNPDLPEAQSGRLDTNAAADVEHELDATPPRDDDSSQVEDSLDTVPQDADKADDVPDQVDAVDTGADESGTVDTNAANADEANVEASSSDIGDSTEADVVDELDHTSEAAADDHPTSHQDEPSEPAEESPADSSTAEVLDSNDQQESDDADSAHDQAAASTSDKPSHQVSENAVPDKRQIPGVRRLLPSPAKKSARKTPQRSESGPKRFVSGARRTVGPAEDLKNSGADASRHDRSPVGVTSADIPKQRTRATHNMGLCRATAPWQYQPADQSKVAEHSNGALAAPGTARGQVGDEPTSALWSPISPQLPQQQHSNCPLPRP